MSVIHDTSRDNGTGAPPPVRRGGHDGFPWRHVVGFALSLILTAVALLVGLHSGAPLGVILFVILGLAALQIFVQLFFFMHVMETDEGPAYQGFSLTLAFVFTIAIVAGSMWIMTFGSQVS